MRRKSPLRHGCWSKTVQVKDKSNRSFNQLRFMKGRSKNHFGRIISLKTTIGNIYVAKAYLQDLAKSKCYQGNYQRISNFGSTRTSRA